MKVSAWIGIFAATGMLALGACSSDDSDDGTGGSAGSGTGGSAGSGTGGSAGSGATGGSAGSGATGGSAGSGATGGSAGSGTGGSAGAGDGGVDCTACVTAECTTEIGTCSANTDCLAILSCAGNCADNACIQQCYDDNPAGQSDWDAVEACAQQNCPQCNL